jgi:hypothetical protein
MKRCSCCHPYAQHSMMRVANCTSQTLYPLERNPVPTKEGLGGPQNQSRQFREEKILLPLPGFSPWIVQAIACLLTVLCSMYDEAEVTGSTTGRKKKGLGSGALVF